MANVPTQLSPGVNITEIDLSGIVREAGNNISGFVGQFRWGPASENLAVDTERRFTDIFLPPTNNLPEKMQDDFFSVTNYFRYSDKLKIVRVVHENARNARAGQSNPAAPILIHNDEEFFAKADPTGVGAKNYSAVLSNANWIARYPGDVGNSIEVVAVGAGTFVQGSLENPAGGGGNEVEPPVESNTFFLPLIKNGAPVQGVTYALVTVPQITELNSLPSLLVGGATWASRFIGDGTTLPSGNTFGIKYLCFYLRGSSYCNNAGSFPIPGGSYAYIAGSNTANGLTYSEYYRDRWFYGTFGVGDNETAGSFWTKEGPLLSAKLDLGLTFAASGNTWTRSHNFGKGFHQTRSDNHSQSSGMFGLASPFGPASSTFNGSFYQTYRLKHGLVSVFDTKTLYPDGYYATTVAQDVENMHPTCYERFVDEQTTRLRKPATHISNIHIPNPWLSSDLSMPIFAILPFDNNASAITEPVSNEFNTQLTYSGGNTAFGGITNAAYSITRTSTAYRNYTTGRVVYKWGGTGITNDGTDTANFPLRPVIDSFPGITAAGNKGMIIMMAFAQPVTGITTGILSTWHVGITTDSTEYTANNLGSVQAILTPIANIDGLIANGADVASSTNILQTTLSNAAQLAFGLDGELDATFVGGQVSNKSSTDPNSSIATGVVVSNFPALASQGSGESQKQAGQAIPFKQSEIPQIFDLIIRKKDSN